MLILDLQQSRKQKVNMLLCTPQFDENKTEVNTKSVFSNEKSFLRRKEGPENLVLFYVYMLLHMSILHNGTYNYICNLSIQYEARNWVPL